jgi:outer membrane protein
MCKVVTWMILVLVASSSPALCADGRGFGLEVAAGIWYQDPSGDISYKSNDKLSIQDDLNYGNEYRMTARAKIFLPSVFPNIYLGYTPIKFDERGETAGSFSFGGSTFVGNVAFDSKTELNLYDIGLFYTIPLVNTSRERPMLSLDLGLTVRTIEYDAEIVQGGIKEHDSGILPVPLIHAGVAFEPVSWLAFELEGRGIAFEGDYVLSGIGRVKLMPWGPLFVAGGYRYEKIKIDQSDLDIDATITGPFAELGLNF